MNQLRYVRVFMLGLCQSQKIISSLPNDQDDDHMATQCIDEQFALLKRLLETPSNPRLVHVTLVAVERFISSDILVGAGPGLPPPPDTVSTGLGEVSSSREGTPPLPSHKILMDDIVSVVSDCVRRNSQDDNIQLAGIRCVLAAVMSSNRLVHGSSLMTCIRMCYFINKDSKSTQAQSEATLALTQMLNAVIVSLERSVDSSNSAERSKGVLADWTDSYSHQLINKTVLLHQSSDEGKYGWCIVCDSPANYHCMQTRDPICSWKCKRENLKRIDFITNNHLISDNHPVVSPGRKSIEYQDVLSVFRSLCKLSAGTPSGGGGPFSTAIPDIRIVKAKRLSLELISAMLESSGPSLKNDSAFIEMIQHVLIVSLLTNSVSPVPKIFTIALNIFSQLLRDFRKPLIREIGIFIDKVFLYILESENASFAHKAKVLEIFKELCFDAKSAIEIFQFFDCAIGERNVFELSINCLAGIAIGRFSGITTFPNPPEAALCAASVGATNLTLVQQDELKKLALNCLISLIESTSKWLEKDHVTPVPQSAVINEAAEDDDVSRTTTPPPGVAKQRKDQKNQLETALELFKKNPGKGIDLLVELGFVPNHSPQSIAKALKELPNLDKTSIGNFLGEFQDENLKIFYAFVDLFNFTGMELDVALRHFLSFFRLPGEAQKIDRIMEKFAEKFFYNNPSKFPNADCAYVLSFAVIMLNTDLHSAQVKKKMTMEEFVKLGKGINTDIEIPESELVRLYKNIEAEEITLSDASGNKTATSSTTPAIDPNADPIGAQRRRFEMFIRETERMIETTRSQLTSGHSTRPVLIGPSKQMFTGTIKVQRKSASHIPEPVLGDIPPLILAISWPVLHALKYSLSPEMVPEEAETIFQAWTNTVKVCGHFHEDLEPVKSEFIKQLFHIAQTVSLKDPSIDPRSIDAIEALIDMVVSHPNLVLNWVEMVTLFSMIDKWNYLSFRLKVASTEPEVNNVASTSSLITSMVGGAKKWWFNRSSSSTTPVDEIAELSQLEKDNLELLVSCTADAQDKIDSLFYQSTLLSPMSVLNLVRALVEVSKTFEITSNPPRLFCLQKLVEVADFNMHRIRIVWSKIWAEIHPYLVFIASSSSAASFSIDALRQLALKYLVKSELSNYHFQAEFLRPFLVIMSNGSTNVTSKNLVMDIVCSLAKTVPENIKSGWVSLFSICQIAAASSAASDLVTSTIDFISTININHPIKIEYFREFFEILTILVMRRDLPIDVHESVSTLIDSNIANVIDGDLKSRLTEFNKGGIWLTVFQTLATVLCDSRQTLREKANRILFSNLLDTPGQLDHETVRIFIRGVLVPLVDDQVHADDMRDSLIIEIAFSFSQVCVKNFQQSFFKFVPEIFSVFQILLDSHHSDKLPQTAIDNIRNIFTGPNIVFLANHSVEWLQFCDCMNRFVDSTIPDVLMEHAGGKHVDLTRLPFDPQEVMNTCVAHLSVLALVLDIVDIIERSFRENKSVWLESFSKLANSVEKSYNFAVRFNAETGLRERLKKLGFMKDLRQLPKLIKQEILGLNILLRVFSANKDGERLRSVIVALVDEYVEKERLLSSVSVQVQDHVHEEIEGSISGFNNLIASQVIEKIFAHMDDEEFNRNRRWIFDLMIKLIPSNDIGVRKAVADCLARRFKAH